MTSRLTFLRQNWQRRGFQPAQADADAEHGQQEEQEKKKNDRSLAIRLWRLFSVQDWHWTATVEYERSGFWSSPGFLIRKPVSNTTKQGGCQILKPFWAAAGEFRANVQYSKPFA